MARTVCFRGPLDDAAVGNGGGTRTFDAVSWHCIADTTKGSYMTLKLRDIPVPALVLSSIMIIFAAVYAVTGWQTFAMLVLIISVMLAFCFIRARSDTEVRALAAITSLIIAVGLYWSLQSARERASALSSEALDVGTVTIFSELLKAFQGNGASSISSLVTGLLLMEFQNVLLGMGGLIVLILIIQWVRGGDKVGSDLSASK